jgi:hypothetical protein
METWLMNGLFPVNFTSKTPMKDEALRDIDPASVHLFAQQGGKFVLTNREIPPVPAPPSR